MKTKKRAWVPSDQYLLGVRLAMIDMMPTATASERRALRAHVAVVNAALRRRGFFV